MEKRKTWWVLLSVAIVNVVGGIVVQALVWIGPMFRSQSSAVGQWLLLWNMVQGLLVVVSGYLGVSAYLKEQRKATRATEVELFDHTIEAINYFDQAVLPELKQVMANFDKSLAKETQGINRNKVRKYVVITVIKQANFTSLFRRLNVLSGYVHYGMVNERQLYASIWDDMTQLMLHQYFQEILSAHENTLLMNNYVDLLTKLKQYGDDAQMRRSQNEKVYQG